MAHHTAIVLGDFCSHRQSCGAGLGVVLTAVVEGRGIQSVVVGGKLLFALMRSSEPMMLRDLAAEADLAPGQAHAYLASFKRVDLVEQDSATGMYILGPAAVRMAIARIRGHNPLASASLAAEDLSREFGVLAAVVTWGPKALTAAVVQESNQSLNINLRPGTTFRLIGSVAGHVYSVFDTSNATKKRLATDLSEAFGQSNASDIGAKQELETTWNEVRNLGYAAAEDSPVPGLFSIAAPVFGAAGQLELSMVLIGRKQKFNLKSGNEIVQRLTEVCHGLSKVKTGSKVFISKTGTE